jgi:hypothetical protein
LIPSSTSAGAGEMLEKASLCAWIFGPLVNMLGGIVITMSGSEAEKEEKLVQLLCDSP